MENMQIFTNPDFGELRVLTIDGEPWIVGNDVAKALGYSDPKAAIRNHVDDEDKQVIQKGQIAPLENHIPKSVLPLNFVYADIPNRGLTVINESGLYALVLSSKLPDAKKYRRWVTSEVLPAIRKTGGYIHGAENMTDEEIMAKAVLVAKRTIEQRDARIRELEAKIDADASAVAYANSIQISDTSITVNNLAKLICQSGYPIGEKRLFVELRERGYLMKEKRDWNLPTQRSMDMGLFEVKQVTIQRPNKKPRICRTPLVTGKGQVYFVNLFLREKAESVVAGAAQLSIQETA